MLAMNQFYRKVIMIIVRRLTPIFSFAPVIGINM